MKWKICYLPFAFAASRKYYTEGSSTGDEIKFRADKSQRRQPHPGKIHVFWKTNLCILPKQLCGSVANRLHSQRVVSCSRIKACPVHLLRFFLRYKIIKIICTCNCSQTFFRRKLITGQNVKQETIGYADVKTQAVEFYVQRSDPYSSPISSVIPFNVKILNEGGAMDMVSGIFTVPKTGTYLFDFSGVKDTSTGAMSVVFHVNDVKKASTFGDDPGQFTMTLPSIWHLTKGDKVKLTITSGTLYSDSKNGPLVHFTGILLEEDIFEP